MFQKILVALGHASSRRHIFEQALQPAIQNKAKLMLVHVLNCEDVVPVPSTPQRNFFVGQSAYESYWQSHENARRKAVEWLDALVQEAKTAGVEAQYVVHDMSPERVIQMQASMWGADLIIVGSHDKTDAEEYESIGDYILNHAPCTVLVLPTRNDEKVAPKALLQSSVR